MTATPGLSRDTVLRKLRQRIDSVHTVCLKTTLMVETLPVELGQPSDKEAIEVCVSYPLEMPMEKLVGHIVNCPLELLVVIFGFLPLDDLKNAMLVCRLVTLLKDKAYKGERHIVHVKLIERSPLSFCFYAGGGLRWETLHACGSSWKASVWTIHPGPRLLCSSSMKFFLWETCSTWNTWILPAQAITALD